MKLSHVMHEDANADKKHITQARRAWAELLEQIKSFLSKKGLVEFDHFEKTYDDLFGPLTLGNFHVSLLGQKYRVEFERRQGTTKGRMRTYKNMHSGEPENFDIVLFQTYDNDLDLISYADFEKQITEAFRNVFIHEYTHLADALRSKNPKGYTSTKSRQVSKGEYINTAHEFNAFYSQVVDDAETMFTKREVVSLFKKSPDFKTFLGLLKGESEAAVVLDSESSGKFRQAFIKRLYQLYKEYSYEMLD